MSRAMRRHPSAAPGGRQRPARASAPKPSPRRQQREPERRGIIGLLRPRWAEEIVSELRKVTWPTREETWYLTVVVIVVASAVGFFLGGVDMFFNWLIDNTLLR